MKTNQAKRLKELERENDRLKTLVADLSLDKAILKEASRGNWQGPHAAGASGRHPERSGLHKTMVPAGSLFQS